MMIGADEVIGSGLRGRIRGIGGIRRTFIESRVVGSKRAVNFVSRDVMETVCPAAALVQPDIACSLEQLVRAQNVGFDKGIRAMDGPVHVALGGKVDERVDLVLAKQFLNERAIPNVSVHELDVFYALKARPVPSIGESIKNDQPVCGIALAPVADEICANESSSARDK